MRPPEAVVLGFTSVRASSPSRIRVGLGRSCVAPLPFCAGPCSGAIDTAEAALCMSQLAHRPGFPGSAIR
jgi:hypothetical protein